MKNILTVLFILIIGFASTFAQTSPLDKADVYYQDRENIESTAKTIKILKTSLIDNPLDNGSLWRLARTYKWLGDQASDKNDKISNYELGKFYAENAIIADEDNIEGHFYLGVLLGKIGETKGALNSLALAEPIRGEMELIIKYAPKHKGAHHVLGELYRRSPGWPLSIGDRKKALKEALLAVKYGPDDTYTHLGLGKVYLDMNIRGNAINELEPVIEMPPHPDYIPEGRADKVEASALLNKLKK